MASAAQLEKLRLELSRRILAGDITQTELAKKVSISQAHLSNFLNRKKGISDRTVEAILTALGLDTFFLLDENELAQLAKKLGLRTGTTEEEVPLVRHSSAMSVALITPDLTIGRSHFPLAPLARLKSFATADREAWTRFVAIQATRDHARFMRPILTDGAILVIDRHYQRVTFTYADSLALYAVISYTNAGEKFLYVGYLHRIGEELIVRPLDEGIPLRNIPPPPRLRGRQQIVGRVAKMTRNL